MAINVKGRVKILDGKAYRHPLTISELEFVMNLIANGSHKIEDMPRILEVTKRLQDEYKLLRKHIEEQ